MRGEIKDVPGHCEGELLSPIQHYKEHGTKITLPLRAVRGEGVQTRGLRTD